MSLVHGQVSSPSVQSLGFPAPSMSFPHPVPKHGLLFGGLFLSLSAWCPELWWALMEREMTKVCWLGADLQVPAKAQCSLCLVGSKCRNSSLCHYPAQSFLPVLCSGPPQQPPQPGWFSITSVSLQGHTGAVGWPLLCSSPPCASCTLGWLLYGQDYSPVNPTLDPRGRKPG